MDNERSPSRIYEIEALGFLAMIALSWANELIGLPGILFGGPVTLNWHEATLETIVAALVWLMVFLMTRKVLKRLRYLEEFLRVCAWCHKVGHQNEWMPIEDYFGRHLDTRTTHGICPTCARKLVNESTTA